MVYSTKQMHDIAVAAAIDKGPSVLLVNGQKICAYALSKKELYQIFVEHGYSADRTRWLSTIEAWGNPMLWDDAVPKEISEPNNWSCKVCFRNLSDDIIKGLMMFAEDNDAGYFPSNDCNKVAML